MGGNGRKGNKGQGPPPSSKPCIFFAKGNCNKGNNCQFSHATQSGTPQGWGLGSSVQSWNGTSAQNSWGTQPNTAANPKDGNRKIPKCKYFAQGRCKNGAGCKFSHDDGGVTAQQATIGWGSVRPTPPLDTQGQTWPSQASTSPQQTWGQPTVSLTATAVAQPQWGQATSSTQNVSTSATPSFQGFGAPTRTSIQPQQWGQPIASTSAVGNNNGADEQKKLRLQFEAMGMSVEEMRRGWTALIQPKDHVWQFSCYGPNKLSDPKIHERPGHQDDGQMYWVVGKGQQEQHLLSPRTPMLDNVPSVTGLKDLSPEELRFETLKNPQNAQKLEEQLFEDYFRLRTQLCPQFGQAAAQTAAGAPLASTQSAFVAPQVSNGLSPGDSSVRSERPTVSLPIATGPVTTTSQPSPTTAVHARTAPRVKVHCDQDMTAFREANFVGGMIPESAPPPELA